MTTTEEKLAYLESQREVERAQFQRIMQQSQDQFDAAFQLLREQQVKILQLQKKLEEL